MAARSKYLFNKISDRLRNHGFDVESAIGLIYDGLTEAQRHFMEDLEVTKRVFTIVLFAGVTQYLIPDWIIRVSGYRFKRATVDLSEDALNPLIEIPNLSTSSDRFITITDDKGVIVDGDKFIMDAYIRPYQGVDFIDEETDPVVEKSFDNALADYVLADYAYLNKLFKTQEQVDKTARSIKHSMRGTNSGEVIKIQGQTVF